MGVINFSKRYNCDIFVIAGSVENDKASEIKYGIDKVFSVTSKEVSIEEAMASPIDSLIDTARKAAKYYKKYYY